MRGMDSCWLLLLMLAVITLAQQTPVAPVPASGAAYAKYKDKLYIYGGRVQPGLKDSDPISGQFFALDLSKRWKSELPAWIPLPEGPKMDNASATISLDGKIFMTTPGIRNGSHRFFFENNTWSPSKASFRESMHNVEPVTLGTDGTVLIVGGLSENSTVDLYDIYSFDKDQSVVKPLPPTSADNSTFLPGRRRYQAAWSESLKSAVFYGGFTGPATMGKVITIYNATSKQWRMLTTTNNPNGTPVEHCMAITDDGKKLVSFGGGEFFNGMILDSTYGSTLAVLDLETGVWSTYFSARIGRGRAVCAIAGDYFLLWGGSVYGRGLQDLFDINKLSTPVSLFHISTAAWVDEYIPSPEYMDPNSPTSTSMASATTTSSTPEPTNRSESDHISDNKPVIGAIAGGSAGAVVVIALVGFLVWRQRRQRAARSRQKGDPSSQDDHNIPADDKREYHTIVGERPPTPPHHTTSSRSPQDARDPGFVGINVNRGQYYGKEVNPYATMHSNPPLAPTFTTAHTHHYPSEDVNVNRGYAANGSLYYPGTTTASSGDRTASGANSHSTSPHFPPPPTWSFDYAPPPPPPALLLAAPQILPQTHALHGVDHRRGV